MGYVEQLQRQLGGFDFSNHNRNVSLLLHAAAAAGPAAAAGGGAEAAAGSRDPSMGSAAAAAAAAAAACQQLKSVRKTGTTICGVVYEGGVVLGADTRATEGPVVADKNCSKLHRISSNMFAAGAGTAADLDHMSDWLATQVELHRLNTYAKGYRGCAIILGGVDLKGPSLFKVHPHGSSEKTNFAAMGSGSLNAMALLEQEYKDNMSESEAVGLVREAIKAGIVNDLGSGGNIDVCIIRENNYQHIRGFEAPVRAACKSVYPPFAINTTPIFSQHVELLKKSNMIDMEQEVEMLESTS